MAHARARACAAQLEDGRVLVAGGLGRGGALASAEVFSIEGSFSAASPMSAPRSGHTCIVLQDGRVLVAGGSNDISPISSAEIYDPVADRWSPAGEMSFSRSGHTATLLKDGRVLITGGEGAGAVRNTIELFDPGTNAFRFLAGAALSSPRKEHRAVRLENGRVLIAGGSDGAFALDTSDIFDPEADSVSAGPKLATPRVGLSATALLDGRVLLAGGSNGSENLASAEIFDPADGKLHAAGRMSHARSGHLAFLLPSNNQVLLIGGDQAAATAELFTPWRRTFGATGGLDGSRSSAAAAAPGVEGTLLVAGGRSPSQVLESSSLYRFATVKTDRDDYGIGAPVRINGSGWQPGERVSLLLQDLPKKRSDRTIAVTADASGNFSASTHASQDDSVTYVTAQAVSADAQARFANQSASLDQCANGPASAPKVQCTGNNWVNGNVNASKAQYSEGDSLPYRLVMKDLSLGSHSVIIEWDTTQGGKHAIDYLTTYNRTETNANPCSGVSGCGAFTTFPIPVDPGTSAMLPGRTQLPDQVFTLFGGTITSVSAYTLSGSYAGNSATSITINFTASVTNPVLTWAGHIATRPDWGANASAVAISGSPFHTRLLGLDGSGGNQDRSLSNEAVIFPGSIKIIKQANVPSSTSFPFAASPSPLTNFNLIDSTAGVDATESILFSDIKTSSTFTATVAETVPSGWDLVTIACAVTSANGGNHSVSTPSVTINLKEGEDWTCTFSNNAQAATVKLTKNLSPTSDPGKFNLTINGKTENDKTHGDSAQTTVTVNSTVNLSETAGSNTVLSNYSSSISCPGHLSPVTGTSASFTVPLSAAGSTIECTVTNTRKTHKVTLTKVLSPAADGGTFDLSIAENGQTPATGNRGHDGFIEDLSVAVGNSVTVSETSNANYTSQLTCTGATISPGSTTSATFNMPDNDVTCTLTNTRKSHTVTVRKVVLPDGDTGGPFSVKINDAGQETPASLSNNGEISDTDVKVGHAVIVSETANNNYTTSVLCTAGAQTLAQNQTTIGTFDMPDADVLCVFTNTRKTNTVTLRKVVLPAADPGTFIITIVNGATKSSDPIGVGGGFITQTVAVGASVTLSEAGANGTNLANYTTGLTCDGVTPTGTNSATFTMPDGAVDCTYTNTRKSHTVTLRKALLPVSDGGTFILTISNGTSASSPAVGDGGLVTKSVAVGDSVTLSEAGANGTNLAYYTTGLSCTGASPSPANPTTFTMPDGAVDCTYTNTRKTRTVTLRKVVSPTTDLGKFNLIINNGTSTTYSDQGHLGSGSKQVAVGASVTLSEEGGTGTNLSDYSASFGCLGGSPSNQTFTMPDADVDCTFTNTLKTATLTIYKVCAPTTDTTTVFTIDVAGPQNTFRPLTCNGGSSQITLKIGTYTVSEQYPLPGSYMQPSSDGTLINGWKAPAAFAGDCSPSGSVTLAVGENKVCGLLNVNAVCTPQFPPTAIAAPAGNTAQPAAAPRSQRVPQPRVIRRQR